MILVYGSSNFFSDSQAITLENVMSSKRTLQDIFTSHRPSLSSHHGSNSVRKNRKSVDVSDVVGVYQLVLLYVIVFNLCIVREIFVFM